MWVKDYNGCSRAKTFTKLDLGTHTRLSFTHICHTTERIGLKNAFVKNVFIAALICISTGQPRLPRSYWTHGDLMNFCQIVQWIDHTNTFVSCAFSKCLFVYFRDLSGLLGKKENTASLVAQWVLFCFFNLSYLIICTASCLWNRFVNTAERSAQECWVKHVSIC